MEGTSAMALAFTYYSLMRERSVRLAELQELEAGERAEQIRLELDEIELRLTKLLGG